MGNLVFNTNRASCGSGKGDRLGEGREGRESEAGRKLPQALNVASRGWPAPVPLNSGGGGSGAGAAAGPSRGPPPARLPGGSAAPNFLGCSRGVRPATRRPCWETQASLFPSVRFIRDTLIYNQIHLIKFLLKGIKSLQRSSTCFKTTQWASLLKRGSFPWKLSAEGGGHGDG